MPLVYRKNSGEHEAEITSYNPDDKVLTVVRTSDGEVRSIELADVLEIDSDLDMSSLSDASVFLRDVGAAGLRPNDDQTELVRVEEGGEYVGPEYDSESEVKESRPSYEKEIVIAAGLLVLILFLD